MANAIVTIKNLVDILFLYYFSMLESTLKVFELSRGVWSSGKGF